MATSLSPRIFRYRRNITAQWDRDKILRRNYIAAINLTVTWRQYYVVCDQANDVRERIRRIAVSATDGLKKLQQPFEPLDPITAAYTLHLSAHHSPLHTLQVACPLLFILSAHPVSTLTALHGDLPLTSPPPDHFPARHQARPSFRPPLNLANLLGTQPAFPPRSHQSHLRSRPPSDARARGSYPELRPNPADVPGDGPLPI